MKQGSLLNRAALAAILALAAGTAACSGGATGPGLPPLQATAKQGVAPGLRVRVTIKVALVAAARPKRPHFISPATKSLKMTIAQNAQTVLTKTVDLTPSSTGCTSSLASVTCTLDISLAAGQYSATLTTFDAINGTGKELSTAQNVAFSVTAGGNNEIPLALSGIPHALVVASAGANAVYALVQDADGNFIVGVGAPLLVAAKTGGAAIATITQPTLTAPNRFDFALAASPAAGTETIGITAKFPEGETNGCAQTGAVCSFPTAVTATYRQTLLVANTGGGSVLGYAVPLAGATQPPDSVVGVPDAYDLAFDTHGNLFASSSAAAASMYEIAAPYAGITATDPNNMSISQPIVIDSHGNAFVGNNSNGTDNVVEFGPPYTGAPKATITNGANHPYTLAMDSSDTLYMANYFQTLIALQAPYTGTPVSVSLAGKPHSMLLANGRVYVGEDSAIEVFTLPLTNASKPVITLSDSVNQATGLALDKSGDLWVADFVGYGGEVQEFPAPIANNEAATVTINETPYGTALYDPTQLAFDNAGNLYVLHQAGGYNSGGVNEYMPPINSGSKPNVSLDTNQFSFPTGIAMSKPAFTISP